ncbi:hypothetical protein ACEU6E_10520 (plasmid) [Halorutilales archaeon Cl-col2-1]
MARSRALMTERERELIQQEEKDNRSYQAISTVRNKIEDELPKDIEILEEYHPELLEDLREVVCED